MTAPAASRDRARLWDGPSLSYMSGEFLSQTGTYVSATAQAWVVLEATGDPLALGVFMAVRYAPAAVAAPFIGRFVDRHRPRGLILSANGVQAALALLTAYLARTPQALEFWPFVLAGAAGQLLSVLEYSGRTSYLGTVVPDELRTRFTGATTSASTLGRVAGPAIAGVLLAAGPSGFCFVVDAASFLLVTVLLPRPRYPLSRAGAPASLAESFRVVWRLPAIRDMLIVFTLVSLVSFNVATLIPLMARDGYANDPAVLALFNAAFGVGSFAGGAIRAAVSIRPTTTAMAGLAVFGVAFAAAGTTTAVWLVSALLFVAGLGRLMFAASSNAVLVVGVSPGLRGFVGSLYAFAFTGVTPVGALLVTSLSEGAGIAVTLAVCGAAAVLGALAYVLARRHGRRTPARPENPSENEERTRP